MPESIRKNLPKHAQDIFLAAYNNASTEYQDPEKRRGGASLEEVARKVAWAAVKKEYRKNSQTGVWERL
ncbi:MAG: ChaB family protein [Chloroflexota bacterium]